MKAQENVTVLANGSISHQGAAESVKGSVHIEAAKPLSLAESSIPSNIAVSGSIKPGRNTAILADGHVTVKTSTLKVSDGLYLQTGKT